jgi:hypothetical protein
VNHYNTTAPLIYLAGADAFIEVHKIPALFVVLALFCSAVSLSLYFVWQLADFCYGNEHTSPIARKSAEQRRSYKAAQAEEARREREAALAREREAAVAAMAAQAQAAAATPVSVELVTPRSVDPLASPASSLSGPPTARSGVPSMMASPSPRPASMNYSSAAGGGGASSPSPRPASMNYSSAAGGGGAGAGLKQSRPLFVAV